MITEVSSQTIQGCRKTKLVLPSRSSTPSSLPHPPAPPAPNLHPQQPLRAWCQVPPYPASGLRQTQTPCIRFYKVLILLPYFPFSSLFSFLQKGITQTHNPATRFFHRVTDLSHFCRRWDLPQPSERQLTYPEPALCCDANQHLRA